MKKEDLEDIASSTYPHVMDFIVSHTPGFEDIPWQKFLRGRGE
jgi:hypothetical protein